MKTVGDKLLQPFLNGTIRTNKSIIVNSGLKRNFLLGKKETRNGKNKILKPNVSFLVLEIMLMALQNLYNVYKEV